MNRLTRFATTVAMTGARYSEPPRHTTAGTVTTPPLRRLHEESSAYLQKCRYNPVSWDR
jgi:hypothetical protein